MILVLVLVTALCLCQHTHRKINFTNNGKTIRNKNYNFTIKFLFMSVNLIENKIENSLVILFPFFSELILGYYSTHFPQIHIIYLVQSINPSHIRKSTFHVFHLFLFILKKVHIHHGFFTSHT